VTKSHEVSEITRAVKHTIYKLNVYPTFVTSTISFFPGIPPPYHVLGEAMRREEDMILLQPPTPPPPDITADIFTMDAAVIPLVLRKSQK
jgi:hypothetical protein